MCLTEPTENNKWICYNFTSLCSWFSEIWSKHALSLFKNKNSCTQPGIFQDKRSLLKWEHFDKHCDKHNTSRKDIDFQYINMHPQCFFQGLAILVLYGSLMFSGGRERMHWEQMG